MSYQHADKYIAQANKITDATLRAEVVRIFTGAKEEGHEWDWDGPSRADDAFDGAIENELDDASADVAAEVNRILSSAKVMHMVPTHQRVVDLINAEIKRKGLEPLAEDQIAALMDPAKAFDLLDESLANRCGLNVTEARELVVLMFVDEDGTDRPRTVSAVRAVRPNLEHWHTGGGCTALRHDRDDGGYVMITEHDDAHIPSDDETLIACGIYDKEGYEVRTDIIPPALLDEWLDNALRDRAANTATNVYDYFYAQLGLVPVDDTLRELPVDSGCGADCVAAIDAASSLLHHARTAGGDTATPIINATSDIVRIYWRG
jgi:hypothetical protein